MMNKCQCCLVCLNPPFMFYEKQVFFVVYLVLKPYHYQDMALVDFYGSTQLVYI